jgi:hypothetical protein
MDAYGLKMELWRVCRRVVADLHNFNSDPHQSKKSVLDPRQSEKRKPGPHPKSERKVRIRNIRILDTGGKFATGINTTSETGGKISAGVVDTGGKFSTSLCR